MAAIEYTKLNNEFLITGCREDSDAVYEIRFEGEASGTLYLAGEAFGIHNGVARVCAKDLANGIHTPILQTETTSFICDKIKIEAGIITPQICIPEKIQYLNKKLIYAEQRACKIEEKIFELCNAVYGKSIL